MRAIGMLLRFFVFVFNLLLSLGLFFLALVVMPSGKHNIDLSAVPLKGSKLTYTLLIGSICGFVAIVLALRRGKAARFPMLAWNLLVTGLLLATPLRGPFSFEGREQALTWIYVITGSVAALWGSALQWRHGK